MARFRHRVAFNADLFLTIETDSGDDGLEQLEPLIIARLQEINEHAVINDLRMPIAELSDVDGVIFPRISVLDHSADSHLENLTYENCEEVTNA
jgi:hypothetical protein